MPKFVATKEWEGQDAVIVGGGSSLKNFDFSRFKGKNVIGCNDAFRLGAELIPNVLFGDTAYFHRTKWELEKYSGRLITCATSLANLQLEWLHQVGRTQAGLGTPDAIGWNYSTGAAAIALAFHFGAVNIYLLGFDMNHNEKGETHWHNHRVRPTQQNAFIRHIRGLSQVAAALREQDRTKVFNVTDGSSRVLYFPLLSFEEFLKRV